MVYNNWDNVLFGQVDKYKYGNNNNSESSDNNSTSKDAKS